MPPREDIFSIILSHPLILFLSLSVSLFVPVCVTINNMIFSPKATPEDAVGSSVADAGAAAGDMGEEGGVPAGRGRVRRRPGQRLEVSLHLLSKWRR